MRRLMYTVATMAMVLGLAGVAAAQDKVAQGKALFDANKCSICHSVAGKGNPKGSLDGVGSKLSAAEIKEWITDPAGMYAKTKATRKPPMIKKSLKPDEVDALVAYLASLKK